jgi:hypothetical protein
MGPDAPTLELSSPTIPVGLGTVENTVTVQERWPPIRPSW